MPGWLTGLIHLQLQETCMAHLDEKSLSGFSRPSLDRELVIHSFRSCALTVAPDGSEDGHIHCLKEGQP